MNVPRYVTLQLSHSRAVRSAIFELTAVNMFEYLVMERSISVSVRNQRIKS